MSEQKLPGRPLKASLAKLVKASIKYLIDVPEGTPLKVLGIDVNGMLVKADGGGGGGGGLSDGDYGDITVSGTGTVMSIDTGAVGDNEVAFNSINYNKLAHLPANFLLGRQSNLGTGAVQAMGYGSILENNSGSGLVFKDNSIASSKIQNDAITNAKLANNAVDTAEIVGGAVTQAKLSATGAAAGKVLTTDGTNHSWQTASGAPIGTLNMAFEQTNSDNVRFTTSFIDRMATDRIDYTVCSTSVLINTLVNLEYAPYSIHDGTSTYTRYGILYDGTNYFFPGWSGRLVMGAQKTADFATFIHEDQPILNAFPASYTVGTLWNDIATNACAIMLTNGTERVGFIVNNAGVWSDFIKPPLVGGKYLAPSTGSSANVVYQNGVLSAYMGYNNANRYWTEDLGVTWTACTNGFNDRPVHRMADGTLYSYTSNSWKYSTDNGKTWTSGTNLPAMPTADKSNHCIDFNGTNYVFVADGTNSVWTASTLGGAWTLRTSAFTTSNPKHVYWCGDLFIALSTASQLNYAMSSADGITWVQRTGANAAAMRVAVKTGARYIVSGSGRTEQTASIGTNFASIVAAGSGLHENAFVINKQANKLVFSSGDGNAVYMYETTAPLLTTITSSQQQTAYALGLATPTNTRIKWR